MSHEKKNSDTFHKILVVNRDPYNWFIYSPNITNWEICSPNTLNNHIFSSSLEEGAGDEAPTCKPGHTVELAKKHVFDMGNQNPAVRN